MKAVRWSGISLFLAIIVFLVAITHFFVDSWIKQGIESFGEKALGAEVNVAEVKHSYSPLGITLMGVQLTDPNAPENNKVQFSSIVATLDVLPLFMNKIIIDQLQVDGAEFDVARVKPGRVYKTQEPVSENEEGDTSAGFNVELPSVDDVLAKANLKSETAQKALKSSYKRLDNELREKYKSLPNEAALKNYEAKIKALTEREYSNPADFLVAQEEFKQLKSELKNEQKKISDFKKSASAASDEITDNIGLLKDATNADYNQLKGLLAGNVASLNEITALLFGEQAKVWAQRLFSAYDMVVPLLQTKSEQEVEQERAHGRWVEFSEEKPLPSFLVKNAKVSIVWQGQTIESHWLDITTEHDVLGRATQFSASSLKSSQWESLLIKGDFWLAASGLKGNQLWDIKGIVLEELPLTANNALGGQLAKAGLNSSGTLQVADNALNGAGIIDFVDLVLQMEGQNTFTSNVAKVLNDLTSLTIDAGINGKLSQPEFSFGSDLDRQLQKGLAKGVASEGQEQLNELRRKLNLVGDAAKSDGESALGSWQQLQDLASGKTENIEQLLKAKFENTLEKEKNRLEDELRKRLFR